MRSAFNGFSCLGLMFILGGSVFVIGGTLLGWSMIYTWIGAIELLVGLILVIEELIFIGRWNKRVGIIRTNEKLTLQEAASKTGTSPEKARSLIY